MVMDVAGVLDRMRGVQTGLPDGDGVAVFNRVYAAVTEEVRRRLAAGDFADRAAAGELAVRFAGRYLAAVADDAAGRRPPACWRPLFAMRAHPGVRPLQFALAGINAHVGHDLALAVVDTCTATGRAPAGLEADFDRVGEALTAIEEEVRELLMPGPDLLEAADPLTHLVGSWSLARARDAAWAAARLLWALRGTGDARDECVSRLDAGVGLIGRLLLTPVGGGRQSSGSMTGEMSS
ncbi:DUF5995 family protein [Actinacidiphila bryophytorum]|uniref:Uncharacterized protein n=1 Tax=Actinacidiphila bryophytorum TaxID=1436133 RepID=A0A9W4H726_9ACTN|nr:DUF5995 family protein [Actinacidiphila bryophytorum]MBM9439556.1 hypothetical protein [Actinacidiphila bryophytorum]MBN6544740.1 hypothetical protein [Actinacidiphila bryophytorum]CAG7655378.1 conserved hypothetical protein [Actinacidiphila bryophytorum]